MTADLHIVRPANREGYEDLWKSMLEEFPWNEPLDVLLAKVGAEELTNKGARFKEVARELFRGDLYALMRYGLSHGDRIHANVEKRWLDQDWLYEKVRRVDRYSRGGKLHRMLLYWARGHWKTTIMQALVIQKILQKPDIRINYYSRTEPMARRRAGGVRKELESNPLLFFLFPEILWGPDPKEVGAEDWSDGSITVKREAAGRSAEAMSESTLQCFGINAVATGGHPNINIVDDAVDDTNAHSATMTKKVARQMGAIIPASDPSSKEHRQDWFVGTDYSRRSPYKVCQEQGIIRSVWHESAVDFSKITVNSQRDFDRALEQGVIEGVLLTNDELKEYRGKGTEAWTRFCLQYLCRVDMASKRTLDASKLSVYTTRPDITASNSNIYICVDPAGYPGLSQPQSLCDSAIGVFALGADGMIRWLDGSLDLLDAASRMRRVISYHRKWSNYGYVVEARIEEGGTGGDVSFLCELQQRENYVFPVARISRGGGPGAQGKTDRIHDRVGPLMEKLVLPQRMVRQRRHEDHCLVQVLREAIDDFPASSDDQFNLLDMISLLTEPPDKTVMVFQGGREPETRPLGPLKWPKKDAWRLPPLNTGPRVSDGMDDGSRGMANLLGVGNLPARTFRQGGLR